MSLEELRGKWSDILSHLENQDRMAWLSFFDARLAKLEGKILYLDYSDVRKFSGQHEYSQIRQSHIYQLQIAIHAVADVDLQIKEIP